MTMRRSDREILDRETIDSIIARCSVCRLGLIVDGRPYVVPLCFGYDGTSVFFHMAKAGKKVAGLRAGNQVCVEFDIPGAVVKSPEACNWTMSYQSVVAYGPVTLVESVEDKRAALATIMRQYAGKQTDWSFPASVLENTLVAKVDLMEITGKASPPEPAAEQCKQRSTDDR